METTFSMQLVLEPYKYEWNTLINARYTAKSILFFSVWRNARQTGSVWRHALKMSAGNSRAAYMRVQEKGSG
jgi:hypothetical protein